EQVQLEVTHVLGAELVGGSGEVLGEASDVVHVGFDGPLGVVAQAQVVDEALTKRGHGVILGRIIRAGATVATGPPCRKDGSRSRRAQVPKWEKAQKTSRAPLTHAASVPATVGFSSGWLDHREAVSFNEEGSMRSARACRTSASQGRGTPHRTRLN